MSVLRFDMIAKLDQAEPLAEAIRSELVQVTAVFDAQLESDQPCVNALARHIEHYRGKMLRPMLVLLSAAATDRWPAGLARILPGHRVLAATVEMIHMATLVHDDVLDEAELRRKGRTINALSGNEAAVMLGDYLISNAFHLCSSLGDPRLNLALGKVTNTLCEGELVQLSNRGNWDLDEPTYFEIVRRKTASLVGASCELGAELAGANDQVSRALGRFGEDLGIAVQIQDDVLDLMGTDDEVGQSKGKLTLPVVKLLRGECSASRARALDLIQSNDALGLRAKVVQSGSLEAARNVALGLVHQAKGQLACVPPGPVRDLLHTMADAVVDRSA
jgi:octaprenyl-diphosphate synthase